MAEVRCPICGRYEITGEAVDLLPRWTLSEGQRAGLAFAIRRMTDRPDPPRLTREIVLALKDTATVPRPEGLLDEAVLWFGNHSEHVGKMFSLGYGYRSILGAWNVAAFNFVAEWMLESRLFAGQPMRFGGGMPVSVVDCQLTRGRLATVRRTRRVACREVTTASWPRTTETQSSTPSLEITSPRKFAGQVSSYVGSTKDNRPG